MQIIINACEAYPANEGEQVSSCQFIRKKRNLQYLDDKFLLKSELLAAPSDTVLAETIQVCIYLLLHHKNCGVRAAQIHELQY